MQLNLTYKKSSHILGQRIGETKRKGNQKQKVNKAETKWKGRDDSSDSEAAGFVIEHALRSGSGFKDRKGIWIIDSGATGHMCHDELMFAELSFLKDPIEVTLGDGHLLHATGKGTVRLDTKINGKGIKQVDLYNVCLLYTSPSPRDA